MKFCLLIAVTLGGSSAFLAAQTPSPAGAGLDRARREAVDKSRKLLNQVRAEIAAAVPVYRDFESKLESVQSQFTAADSRASESIKADEAVISGIDEITQNLSWETEALRSHAQSLRAHEQAIAAAIAKGVAAATRICAFAQQSAQASEEQIKTWQADATSLLSEASNQLNIMQEVIAPRQSVAPKLINLLRGYEMRLDADGALIELSGRSDTGGEVALTQLANEMAATARLAQALNEKWEKADAMAGQVQDILKPYADAEEATALVQESERLEWELRRVRPEMDSPYLGPKAAEHLQELIAKTRAVRARLTETRKAVEGGKLVADAEAAMKEADAARTSLVQAAENPKRYEPLQRASQCLAQIKYAPAPVAAAISPAPDEVIVPDLSVFDSVDEMKAGLQHVGLKGTFAQGKIEPPEKKKEFKFAAQSPAAHTIVKKDSVVAVTTYPKFVSRTLVSGVYQVETDNRGTVHPSTWKLIVTGNKIAGSSEWQCCPGKRKDPLSGEINQKGNTVVITRDCNGQGITQPCRQVYVGEVVGGIIQGTFSGTLGSKRDNSPQNIWVLHLK